MTTSPPIVRDSAGSGRAGAWQAPTLDEHRSPCPALNALANEGALPRSGRVTVAQLVEALDARLGIPPILGAGIAQLAMVRLGEAGPDGVEVLDLARLVKHGFLEHDASLTRRDARDGDAAQVVPPLVEQLLSFSEDGRTLTLEDLATAHRVRMAQSATGGHHVPLKAGLLGIFEAALLYQVFGQGRALALGDAGELLEKEQLPAGVGSRRLGLGALLLATARLGVMSNLPFSRTATRAREAMKRSVETAAPGCPFAFLRPVPRS